jgi:hypothetical protein
MTLPPHEDYITWRDLEAHRQQESIAMFELEARMARRMEPVERRIDSLESVIDQQRGAKALVYFLIGSNLLAIIGMLVRAGA